MRISLILLVSSMSVSEALAVAVQADFASLSKQYRESKQQIMVQELRGGALEKGDQKALRRFASGGNDNRMPSLFGPEESEYNKFAACLAATEGLRRMRDQALLDRAYRGPNNDSGMKPSSEEALELEKRIASQYQANSGRVLRAMGMPVERFNELGREISKDERLKEKVMEQAYLYRMAAMVNLDQIPLMSGDGSGEDISGFKRDKVQLFCRSVREIEQLRAEQVDRLKKSLHVDSFPSSISISDPALIPFLSPKVRAVVRAFPLQAEDVVKRNGLESDEFNSMLQEVRTNPIFRWKVQKHLKQGSFAGDSQGSYATN